jgi:membrane protease YdiL (CAAX protease family)
VKSFTLRFALALILGLAAAVIVAPLAAVAVARFHLPFPRIFDRVVMVTLLASMLLFAASFRLGELMRAGFASPLANLRGLLLGLALSLTAIAILFAIAVVIGAGHIAPGAIAMRAITYIPAALAIGVIEEAFFRAFLLGGIRRDFGQPAALIISSAIYAFAHLVRAPGHFFLSGYHPRAGLDDLVHSATRLLHPGDALPSLLGLFLLGLVLGEAFILTGTVWCSLGMHAGFVVGAKTWPAVAPVGAIVPRWLAGPRPVPLIAAPAGWALAILLLLLMPTLVGRTRHST